MKKAKMSVTKDGSSISIEFHNRSPLEKAKVIKADSYNTPFTDFDEGFADNFTDTETGPARYKGQILGTGPTEVINTSTEIINSSSEFIYKESPGVISEAKFLK